MIIRCLNFSVGLDLVVDMRIWGYSAELKRTDGSPVVWYIKATPKKVSSS